jgi:hypothetical protein
MSMLVGSSFSVILKNSQLLCGFCDSYRRTVHHIVSSGSLAMHAYSLLRDSDAACSYLATKSLRSYAGWFGGYGWDLALSVPGHFLEKLEISSL